MPVPVVHVERLLDKTYRATLGDFQGCGRTKSDAIERCLVAVREEARVDTNPAVRVGPDGGIWVLWRSHPAWIYRLPSGSCTILGGDSGRTRDTAIAAMDQHFAQYYAREVNTAAG
jgi:hypothetical protein